MSKKIIIDFELLEKVEELLCNYARDIYCESLCSGEMKEYNDILEAIQKVTNKLSE